LPHDFLLCVQFTVKVLSLRQRFIDLVLELQSLLLQQLNLSLSCIVLNLSVFNGQSGVLKVRLRLQEFTVSLRVLFLLLFVTVDPHVTSLLLCVDLLAKLSDFLSHLFLAKLKLPLDTLLFDFQSFNSPLQVNDSLIHFLELG
jgi:hypothetical protein